MNLLLFLAAVIVSFIVVRIGAIAFQMTGLEWTLAKFQALSCFSSTGFTTKEAELITGNPQRRRIASALIIFGNAGLVTLIATFANSLKPNIILPQFTIPLIKSVMPSWLVSWVNLAIIVVSVFIIFKVFTHKALTNKLTNLLKRYIVKKEIIKRVTFEELLVSTGGYGISQITVGEKSPVVNKELAKAGLRTNDISILVIERGQEVIPNPQPHEKIKHGDRLTCFGKLEHIRDILCPK